MAPRTLTSLQKSYDTSYLIASTAIYYESQRNPVEALRCWRDCLYQLSGTQIPTGYKPKSDAEGSLYESLRRLREQAEDRVGLLGVMVETGRTGVAVGPGAAGYGGSPGMGGAQGGYTLQDLGPLSPIALPERPPTAGATLGRNHASSASSATLQSLGRTHIRNVTLGPRAANMKAPRSPSPDKRLLSTLRGPKKSKASPLEGLWKTARPKEAAQAATMAWSSVGRREGEGISRAGTEGIGGGGGSIRSERPEKIERPRLEARGSSGFSSGSLREGSIREKEELQGVQKRPQMGRQKTRPQSMLFPISSSTSSLASSSISAQGRGYADDGTAGMGMGMDGSLHPLNLPLPPPPPPHKVPLSTLPILPARPAGQTRKPVRRNPSYEEPEGHDTPPPLPPKLPPRAPPRPTGLRVRSVSDTNSHRNGSSNTPLTPSASPSPTTPVSEEPSVPLDPHEARLQAAIASLSRAADPAALQQIANEIIVKGDEVHWSDVAGLEGAKQALKEAVVYPFLRPDLFSGLREPAQGMLLFGPPGTGKTMLARAVATESRSTFFSISASSLTSKYLGESEKLVRALFALSKALAPSIIFVDEIDSLLSARSGGENDATRRIKTEFLIQWSSLARAAASSDSSPSSCDSRILVLAATNLPWEIDEAARRRFARRQYIPLPEEETRKYQLEKLLQGRHELTGEEMGRLVRETEGFSGSDITALAKDAAMGPLRSLGERLLEVGVGEVRLIGWRDFEGSLRKIRPSVDEEGLRKFGEWAGRFGERV
ncbi:putative AAA family ATPase [Pyronema domesticum]|nr:putative AAA family ATPase [Pyronema domesticum]